VSYLDADLREPEAIFAAPPVRDGFDLSRPVAITLIAVLQHIVDDEAARDIVARLMAPLAPGSALAVSAVTTENDEQGGEHTVQTYNRSGVPVRPRSRAEVEALFGGLPTVDPGVVFVHRWRPEGDDTSTADKDVAMYGGVAFKA
jgi:O-methyltransferase involved in polyketide biosynthesis